MKTYIFRVRLDGVRGVSRTIEIEGQQTLDELHQAILDAFEWDDPHLYSFFMSNKWGDRANEYAHPYMLEEPFGHEPQPKDASRAKIGKLPLMLHQQFMFFFDYGDAHEFSVRLIKINEDAPKGSYPRVITSKGEAPPQYPPREDEDEAG